VVSEAGHVAQDHVVFPIVISALRDFFFSVLLPERYGPVLLSILDEAIPGVSLLPPRAPRSIGECANRQTPFFDPTFDLSWVIGGRFLSDDKVPDLSEPETKQLLVHFKLDNALAPFPPET